MLSKIFFFIITFMILITPSSPAQDFSKIAGQINIEYKKFVLDNGLTLLVHEDHKAPIVAVNVWYHVGSKNEKPGKTGFAHLFEHLMFNGSENFDDDYFQQMEKIGATDLNGTTNEDRTNYFENVPVGALDIALWMESDRMGHLLGAITQEKLDEQRGVVQNEKRQGENQPYGKIWEHIAAASFPAGHPYSWTVIGKMEDLDAASLEDVHEWFKTYYGPNNAVLVVAGDIDPQTAYEKVNKYFGSIPPGPPISKHDTWIAKRTGEHREIIQDRVPQARLIKVWNVPQWGTEEGYYLDLLTDILSSGKTSRLYKRLVYDQQIATNASSYIDLREIAGQFYIDILAKPGERLEEIEKAVDEELHRLLTEGPTADELKRVKTQYFARMIRGIERIGGFGGKSDILATNMTYAGDPGFYKNALQIIADATAEDIKNAGMKWLSDGVYVLEVYPYPQLSAADTDADRTKIPEEGPASEIKFPAVQRATLSNGLEIVLAERHSIPVVNFNLVVDAGYAADQFALEGTSKLTMDMIDEGTEKLTALQISEQLNLLGANLSAGSGIDFCNVSLSALKMNLDESLDIYADVILNPSFPADELERLKKQTIAAIQREKVSPVQMILRVMPKIVYGDDHAYGTPLTGSGFESTVEKITVDDLQKFHDQWFKPNNATLIVVGDITIDEIVPKLEKLFAKWEQGEVPRKNIAEVEQKNKSTIFILDRPGSEQSVIFAGTLVPAMNPDDEVAIQSMNNILGGTFTSRVNMNLREDKHWSYGSRTILLNTKAQRMYIAYAPVQSDKTAESMVEIMKELKAITGDKPVTEEEFQKDKKNSVLKLPGSWETMNSVAGSLMNIVVNNLPDDYYQKYPDLIKSLQRNQLIEAAKKIVHPEDVVWIIAGDREKIEQPVKNLNFGNIKYIDADGNIIQ
ncbi:MAG: pitrilysin family protein [Ignavibacteriaceae bacterium]